MSVEIKLDYDEGARVAVLTFANGKTMRLSNISRQKAEEFHTRHAPEFAKRDCCLETPAENLTRGANHGAA